MIQAPTALKQAKQQAARGNNPPERLGPHSPRVMSRRKDGQQECMGERFVVQNQWVQLPEAQGGLSLFRDRSPGEGFSRRQPRSLPDSALGMAM